MSSEDTKTNLGDPWNFPTTSEDTVSSKENYKIEYENLSEWRMGAPLGGSCYLLDTSVSKKFKIFNLAGCPPVWCEDEYKVAIPLWIIIENNDDDESQTIFQRIGVVDAKALTLTIYKKQFRVLHLKSFKNSVISGVDSPMYNSVQVDFDTREELIESVVDIHNI